MSSYIRYAKSILRAIAACMAFAISITAFAGEFFEPGGVAIRGYDPVAYFKDNKAVQGSEKFTALHKRSVFRFASAANRDAFAANPGRYAPQYGGFCAYSVTLGDKVAADPSMFTIHNNKLYLNSSKSTEDQWRKNIKGNIAKADGNWFEVVRKPHP